MVAGVLKYRLSEVLVVEWGLANSQVSKTHSSPSEEVSGGRLERVGKMRSRVLKDEFRDDALDLQSLYSL